MSSEPKITDSGLETNATVETEGDSEAIRDLTTKMLGNSEVLALMQSKLAGMASGSISTEYNDLPGSVKRRVKALKKLQIELMEVEIKYHKAIHAIECEYAKLYQPLYDKRFEIVNANVEPTDEECDFPYDTEEQEETKPAEDTNKKDDSDTQELIDDVKGIPSFWLTIFKNIELIAENIQDYDEPILEHLIDIKCKLDENPMSFCLEFYFKPNEYFTNKVLYKKYEMRCDIDDKDPFSFEGPEISKCTGCKINWNEGKNVTVKTVLKKQKHRSKLVMRTIPMTLPTDSFFNFFSPPTYPENLEDLDEDTQALLSADFEIGEIIRHRIIPRAVLYFTGEALEDEDYDEGDEEDEEDEEEDEDEDYEDEEEDQDSGNKRKKPAKDHKSKGAGGPDGGQECKQQ